MTESYLAPPEVQAICDRDQLRVEGHLGKGAFKSAFMVCDSSGKQFALKIAHCAEVGLERLSREVGALRACNHPHIAKLHRAEIFLHTGQEHVVMIEEFLAGGTLERRLASGRMGSMEVKAIARPLAEAIQHLQSLRLVHRDIKPANILFRRTNEPVLTDFGIVRQLDAVTLTSDFLPQGPGTPLYASPEQLSNDKAAIDWRSDQFGLALVLAECLLGRPPFLPATGDVMAAVRTVAGRGRLPSWTEGELRELGWDCLIKALAPWPIQRFRTPKEFCNAIEEV